MSHPVLRYDRPAADWEREALPLGNGRIGAMVFGTVAREQVQFTEQTLWTGGPGSTEGYAFGNWAEPRPGVLAKVREDIDRLGALDPDPVAGLLGQAKRGFGAYQNFGDVLIELPGHPENPEGYGRQLDLADAVARVSYGHRGVRHSRTYFTSHPAGVLVGRLTADRPGQVSAVVRLAPAPEGAALTTEGPVTEVSGRLAGNGLAYAARLRVVPEGGTLRTEGDAIVVEHADSVTLVLAAGTDYAPRYPHYRGAAPGPRVRAAVEAAARRPYGELLAEHRADHRALFDRMALDLGGALPADVPTDRLLAAYPSGDASRDRALEALYLAHGRYLLIASSRPGGLPANLQGVWNNSAAPPWSADFHANINLQMNYWLAHPTGLGELAAPFDDFTDGLRAPGRGTARSVFDLPGWTMGGTSTPFGHTGFGDWPTAFWFPEAAAWLALQVYDHHRFTGDREVLRERVHPMLREAAEFWLGFLRTDPRDGSLVATPSFSPEHGTYTAGCSMSQQIVHALFTTVLETSELLGVDAEFRAEVAGALDRLDPGLRIGSWGQLQEWKEDLDDPKSEHRHISHLFALHPGWTLDPTAEPELARAAAVSLAARGDGATGWSKGWKINMWARLRDGDHAQAVLREQLVHSTLPNLFDTHPPFQIDGNFGATAGAAEMLLQSQHGVVDVLPALPAAWPDGSVRGLCARGGVGVDVVWRGGKPVALTLRAGQDGPVTVRCSLLERAALVEADGGAAVAVERDGDRQVFHARAGRTYTAALGN
ncbi:glycoside hydrolase family 95 protein [Streptomyces sp. CAS3]